MNEFNNFKEAELFLLENIIKHGNEYNGTKELYNLSFSINDATQNQNGRSKYDYAEEFFQWIMSGDTQLSDKIIEMNPYATRFVDKTGLPESFSSSYGWKIKEQLPGILKLLASDNYTRQAYLNILLKEDQIIWESGNENVEFPCTIGMHFLYRENALHAIVNMRSNNVWSVLPYDVYNFTSLLQHVAKELGIRTGTYVHQMNNAHIFDENIDRAKELISNNLNLIIDEIRKDIRK